MGQYSECLTHYLKKLQLGRCEKDGRKLRKHIFHNSPCDIELRVQKREALTLVIHVGINDLRRTINLDYVMADV
jgi:hypothetical protein